MWRDIHLELRASADVFGGSSRDTKFQNADVSDENFLALVGIFSCPSFVKVNGNISSPSSFTNARATMRSLFVPIVLIFISSPLVSCKRMFVPCEVSTESLLPLQLRSLPVMASKLRPSVCVGSRAAGDWRFLVHTSPRHHKCRPLRLYQNS
ncbi:unnamed protein product [Trypanosoma congolense IL3000]|uniref:WGS project CAEQ00000000 data, annotated contig 827 n=1 Tax=Trypanosoma congolense (strain IL3000) TaxID=1068625 RepID=F9WIS8_TRYCI|nr:unnamed protein product [Trypanosoma congolense IL3000]